VRLPRRISRETSEPEFEFNPQNFLEEERTQDRLALHRTLAKWIVAFIVIFCGAALAFWWSGSAVQYSAARVQNRSNPTYQVTGVITDSRTHQPIPWAEVSTDFKFGGAFFSTSADQDGRYSINTLAEPHDLVVKANGYQQGRIHIGKQWFSWTPQGSERRDGELTPVQQ
jgi:hypothetical protein